MLAQDRSKSHGMTTGIAVMWQCCYWLMVNDEVVIVVWLFSKFVIHCADYEIERLVSYKD